MSTAESQEPSNGSPVTISIDSEPHDDKRTYPKTHVNYWRSKLEHRSYTRGGQTFHVPEWSIRIFFKGIRKSFDLDTANREIAATKARDIYLSLRAKGWAATLSELNPAQEGSNTDSGRVSTVGEFLNEVRRTSTLKGKTFRDYAQAFRQMAAQIQGIKHDRTRYDYRTGGLVRWHEKIHAIPLSAITPTAAADWKIAYLKRAGTDPRRRLEVGRSFNSALRCCKSLFSSKIINQPNFGIKIPRFKIRDAQMGEREVFWFETIGFEPQGSMKYRAQAGITFEGLVRNAQRELRANEPEAYKLFLLCLCGGLRRAEADVCLWSQLNVADNLIRIETNEYIEPKHGSEGPVYVDPSLMNELQAFKNQAEGDFIVNSPLQWKRVESVRYRCAPHWRVLNQWLETNGINARKKVHELRKIFGDAIVKQNGIFAGSAQLRHSSIQMTASHYTDPRQRAILPVGHLFSDDYKLTEPDQKARTDILSSTIADKHLHRPNIKSGI